MTLLRTRSHERSSRRAPVLSRGMIQHCVLMSWWWLVVMMMLGTLSAVPAEEAITAHLADDSLRADIREIQVDPLGGTTTSRGSPSNLEEAPSETEEDDLSAESPKVGFRAPRPQHGEPETPEEDEQDDCRDEHESCDKWATEGECGANPRYMLQNCRYSCAQCARETPEGLIRVAYGPAQDVDLSDATLKAYFDQVETYMMNLYMNETVKPMLKKCANRHASCIYWAAIGECTANPGYMSTDCAAACMACEKADIALRCPWDPNTPGALRPGELDAMFERIMTDPAWAIYQPTVHSRPKQIRTQLDASSSTLAPFAEEEEEEDSEALQVDVQDGPWVVTFETFLTAEECEALIQWGHKTGYERSSDVGTLRFDGTHDSIVSEYRTSTNSWCDQSCMDDPLVSAVLDRIQNLTGIPRNNSESLQLLRYEPGQKYGVHHDYIEHQRDLPVGPRMLTLFMYLNDVEAGGATNFPRLGNLQVQPKQGKALLWPSILNERPMDIDKRTHHEALPVEAGIKYGANAWIHAHDFMTPHQVGCS